MRSGSLMLLLSIFIAVMVTGCISTTPTQQFESSTSPSQSSQIPPDKTILKMDLSRVIESTRSSLQDYFVFYQDISSGGEIQYVQLTTEEASLVLDKGKIFVVGVAKKNEDGWIEMLGFVGSTELGITCIPVGEKAASVIDLGELFKTESDGDVVFNPSISASEFAKMLGFNEELLKQIGEVDITFKNMLNPDINRNGVIDEDENMHWHITSAYSFSTVDTTKPSLKVFTYVFWMNRDYAKGAYGEEFLVNEENGVVYTEDHNIATLTNLDTGESIPSHFVHVEFEHDYQWYFEAPWPKDGNYRLDATGKDTGKTYSFYFQNLRFLNPMTDFEGLVYPLFSARIYSDGKVKEVSWEWYVITSNGVEKPSRELVYMVSTKNESAGYMYFSSKDMFDDFRYGPNEFKLFVPLREGYDFYSDGTANLKDEDFWVQPRSNTTVYGSGNFRMIGEIDASFDFRYDYELTPSDYDENDPPKSWDENSIVGMWYNLYYNAVNEKNGRPRLDLPFDKPAVVIFKDDGTFEMYRGFFCMGDECTFDDSHPDWLDVKGEYSLLENGVLKLVDSDGNVYYLYIEMHEGYFEGMLASNPITTLDRESGSYVVYSRHK